MDAVDPDQEHLRNSTDKIKINKSNLSLSKCPSTSTSTETSLQAEVSCNRALELFLCEQLVLFGEVWATDFFLCCCNNEFQYWRWGFLLGRQLFDE